MYKCTTVSIKRKTSAAMNLTSEDDLLAFFRQNDASLQCLNWCDIDFLAWQVAEGTCRNKSKNVPNLSQTRQLFQNFENLKAEFLNMFDKFPKLPQFSMDCSLVHQIPAHHPCRCKAHSRSPVDGQETLVLFQVFFDSVALDHESLQSLNHRKSQTTLRCM